MKSIAMVRKPVTFLMETGRDLSYVLRIERRYSCTSSSLYCLLELYVGAGEARVSFQDRNTTMLAQCLSAKQVGSLVSTRSL